MTVEEKRRALRQYCSNREGCCYCGCVPDEQGHCYLGSDELMLKNYDRVFGVDNYLTNNPYWERISQMAYRQRQKGVDTYGQGLEANTAPDALNRIEYIQEELIDGLMYLEWLKDILKGETENGNSD